MRRTRRGSWPSLMGRASSCTATPRRRPRTAESDLKRPPATASAKAGGRTGKPERNTTMNDTMKKLRDEARALVKTYTPDCDFEALVLKLAGVGYRMMGAAANL